MKTKFGGLLIIDIVLFIAFSANVFAGKSTANSKIIPFTLTYSTSFYNGFNVSCKGNADGFIDITVNGGSLPFNYSWSNGSSVEDINSLTAGTYKIIVTDNDGYVDSAEITLTEPDFLTITSDSSTNVLCAGNLTGAVYITTVGGVSPYSFLWSDGSTLEDIANIGAANYTIAITDNNGCTATVSKLITEPLPLVITIDSTSNLTCFGSLNGFIYLTVSGGNATYSYLWNDGSTEEDRSTLNGGTYSLLLTDANGCTDSISFVITEPDQLSVNLDSAFNVTCNGLDNGQIFISTSGGTGTISYLWSNGSVDSTIINLPPDSYTVTVTDANSCTTSLVQEITEPPIFKIDSFLVKDVSCYNGNDGSVNVTVSGGTFPYTFSWSDGSTSEDILNLIADSYFLNVTDSNGCSDFLSIQIFQPASALVVQVDSTFNGCSGGNNGSIFISAFGGTAPYSYLWSNGSTEEDILLLPQGNYSVTVTDFQACTFTIQVSLLISNPVSAIIDSTKNNSCIGISDGVLVVTASGGTIPYSYLWDNGATTDTLKSLSPGIFVVTVTDLNGCTTTTSAEIFAPDSILLSASTQSTSCDLSNGSATILATGGTGLFQYLWNTGSTNSTIINLANGTYTITATDANNCTATISVVVDSIIPPSIVIQNSSDPKCFGSSDGSISIAVSNGTSPFTYVWSNGDTNQNQVSLIGGTYSVTVTDFNNCIATATALLSNPTAISILFLDTPATCNLANGSTIALVSGGTGLIQYLWNTGSTNAALTSLIAGTYTVTVADANNCSETTSVILDSITPPSVSIQSAIDPSCFGFNNGSISITVNNGTGPFGFLWSNGNTSQNIASLNAGFYSVTVTDFNGCTNTAAQVLSSPTNIVIQFAVTLGTCNQPNGSVTATISGGVPGYSYLWSNGSTDLTINNLGIGSYTLTVTDQTGCTNSNSVFVNNTGSPDAIVLLNNPVTCFNGTNGSINVLVSGGTFPYTYSWSNGKTTEDITNLPSGTYTLIVTDNHNCQDSLIVVVTQPDIISININSINTTCGLNNGSISATAIGGTGILSYLWNTGSVSTIISNLTPGIYTVTVTDQSLCSTSATTQILPSTVLSVSISSFNNNLCFGGNDGDINTQISGGTSPYSFSWSNGSTAASLSSLPFGTYTVTVTDFSNCIATVSQIISQPSLITIITNSSNSTCGFPNGSITALVSGGTGQFTYLWSNGLTSQTINNLIQGVYSVVVTDQNNCTNSATASVSSAPPLSINLQNVVNPKCFGNNNGALNISVTGGTLPYSYLWSNSATSQNISGLFAGTYTVTVTDFNNCTTNFNYTIVNPDSISLNLITTNATCGLNNGSATAVASGGTGNINYLWSTGATISSINNLAPGAYALFVFDQNGCTNNSPFTILNIQIPLIVIDSFTDVSCFGNSDGQIFINTTGGTTPFNYIWSNGATTQNISNLSPGIYTATVTDFNNCTATISTNISGPSLLTATINGLNTTCSLNNGSAQAIAFGGTAPYTFVWSNSSTDQNAIGLGAGFFTVTITDFNNCTATSSIEILGSNSISLSVTSFNNASCFGASDGNINISVSGGTPNFVYLWSDGSTNLNLLNVQSGTYSLSVSDSKNCLATISQFIDQPTQIQLNQTINQTSCGLFNGSIILNPTGGSGGFTYQWSTGDSSSSILDLNSGIYTVTVTDSTNCSVSSAIFVGNSNGPQMTVDTIININCFGQNNGAISISTIGGQIPYSFHWSNGLTTEDIINLTAGNYTLTVTDNVGCNGIISLTVSQPSQLAVTLSSSVASCGLNIGSINTFTSGGVFPYSYNWSNGATTDTIYNLSSGNYIVTVSDANGCTISASKIVTSTPGVNIFLDSINLISCFGGSNGAIYIHITGGSFFTYQWSNGNTTQDAKNLNTGNYSVIVTNTFGCEDTFSYFLSEPSALSLSLSSTPSTCSDANGSASVIVSGGIGQYSYLWSNGITTSLNSNLLGGTFGVTVTDSNNCFIFDSIVVADLSAPVITPTFINAISCYGLQDGVIDLSVIGASSPFTYLWSNAATDKDISSLYAGTYTITVTDTNNCVSVFDTTLIQPDSIIIDYVLLTPNCGLPNGYISLNVSGGVAPYTYLWTFGSSADSIYNLSGGNYFVTVIDSTFCTNSMAFVLQNEPAPLLNQDSLDNVSCFGFADGNIYLSISSNLNPLSILWSNGNTTESNLNLLAGTYTITVTDSSGCSVNGIYFINEPSAPLSSYLNSYDPICGLANGSIAAIATGGTLPYNYLWSNNNTNDSIFGLQAGIYSIIITDKNGCNISLSDTLTNTPGVTIINDSIINVNCYNDSNGEIYLSANGGNSFVYLWSNGETTEDIINLSVGNYSVTVTNDFGCTDTASFLVDEPDLLIISLSSLPSICSNSDGKTEVVAVGGTAPYSYLWNNAVTTSTNNNLTGGIFIVTVTDAHNCSNTDSIIVADLFAPVINPVLIQNISCYGQNNGVIDLSVAGSSPPFVYQWSNASTNLDLNLLYAGTYTLTVTDTNNCVTVFDTTLVQQDSITINYTLDQPHCSIDNGFIALNVSGGLAPYTYIWNFGSNADSIFNLHWGNYLVTVTDSLGCTKTQSFVLVNEFAPQLNLDSIQNISCNGLNDGGIYLSIVNSFPPLTYLWSNTSTTLNISNLSPGVYTLTITDINNCITVFQDSITQPDSIKIDFTTTFVSCIVDDGTASVSISGGTPPYQYLWNDGSTLSDIDSLAIGTYFITITDAHFCSITDSIVISNPNAPIISSSSITDVICFGNNTGAINIDVTSNNFPLTYLWSNFETNEDLQNLFYGTYTVTITDASNCSSSQIFLVNEPAEINISIATINASCNDSNGTAYITVITGGISPYTYLWNTGATTDSISLLPANNYTLTVTDANGCSKIENANISNLSGPVISLTNLLAASCYGASNGAININVSGNQPFSFIWSNFATTQNISGLAAGTYTITVTDINNCKAVSSFDITQPDSISFGAVLSLNNAPYNVSCYGTFDGFINLNLAGGTIPYSLIWSVGSTNQNLSSIGAGSYTVTITDGSGCSITASYNLSQPPQIISNAGTNQIICGEDSFQLNATVPTYGIGTWSLISGSGTFSDSSSATATVAGLSIGINSLSWIVSDGLCADTSIINITSTLQITANAGIDKSICEKTISLSATKPQFGYGFWEKLAGTALIDDTAQATTPVTNLNYGPNTFQWTVINGTCLDSDIVVITVLDSIDCLQPVEIPTGFTPNGDGKNDYFIIKHIDEYPQNLLSIYNRWGNLVYEKQNYQNEWMGTNTAGEALPDGTYFILLTIKNISKPYKQYVDLRR